MEFIADGFRDDFQPIGGNRSQGHFLVADLTKLCRHGRLRSGQHNVGNTPFLLGTHEIAPGFRIPVFPGKLFVAFVIVAAFAPDITPVGHIVG